MNHLKGYLSAKEATSSKAYLSDPDADLDLKCPCGLIHVVPPKPMPALLMHGGGLARRTPVRQVSAKRAAENRKRRAMIDALYPERPRCARPGCTALADDIHEPLTRGRGGSITDPENAVPLCRACHDEITFRPESELGWAYEAGLLRHSWDASGKAGEVA